MTEPKPTLFARAKAVTRRIEDSWQNVITGLGTARDKRTGARVAPVGPSLDHQRFDDLYAGDDMAQIIAGRAPEDMVRKWIDLTVEEGDEGISQEESTTADDILQALNDIDAKGALREGMTWANVFGGSIVVMGIDDGGGDNVDALAEPLSEDRIRSLDFLEVFDRFDVDVAEEYTDPADGLEKFTKPKTYRINNYQGAQGASVPSVIVHESRVLRFDGPLTSRRRILRNGGWNDSIYKRVESVLADFGLSWGSAAHLIQDFAQAVFKMKGLAEAVAGEEGNLVLTRMAQMDLCRSVARAVPIDAESEEYGREATPITGLAELLSAFVMRLSAAAQMPVTILFGVSPSGLNSTADGDLSIWYDRIGSKQETDLRPRLTRLIELLLKAKEGPTGGQEPEGWEYSFNSLWQASDKEQAEARKIQAETDAIYIDTNVLEPEEVTFSRFSGESYSAQTQIDREKREAEAAEPEVEPEVIEPVVAAPVVEPVAVPVPELETEV